MLKVGIATVRMCTFSHSGGAVLNSLEQDFARMRWQKVDSETAYASLSSWCNANKEETGVISPTKGAVSAIGAFQLWCQIQKIKGSPIDNENIGSTFNCEKKGGWVTNNHRTLEVVWSYAKTLLKDCAGVQGAFNAVPKIGGRDLSDYQKLEKQLGRLGFSVPDMTAALIDYQPTIQRIADEVYESWVSWSAETYAAEAVTLLSDPSSADGLKKIRKHSKARLDGTGLFKSKTASKDGKFMLFPKAKDGLPLLILSDNAETRMSGAVKDKARMFKSSVVSTEHEGSWRQSGNLKSITFAFSTNMSTESLMRAALQALDVVRNSISIEKGH